RGKRVTCSSQFEIALDAEHPRAALEIVTTLDTTGDAGRLGRIVGDRTPIIAEIAAEIRSGPAEGVERLVHRVGLVIGGISRLSHARQGQRRSAHREPLHRNSPTQQTATRGLRSTPNGPAHEPLGYETPVLFAKIYRDF